VVRCFGIYEDRIGGIRRDEFITARGGGKCSLENVSQENYG
jgi:hypothetical protein